MALYSYGQQVGLERGSGGSVDTGGGNSAKRGMGVKDAMQVLTGGKYSYGPI